MRKGAIFVLDANVQSDVDVVRSHNQISILGANYQLHTAPPFKLLPRHNYLRLRHLRLRRRLPRLRKGSQHHLR